MSDVHARVSDPIGSHEKLAEIAADATLARAIEEQARFWDHYPGSSPSGTGWFTDGELTEALELLFNRRLQRNVVARARGLLEPQTITEPHHVCIRRGPSAKIGKRTLTQFRYDPTGGVGPWD